MAAGTLLPAMDSSFQPGRAGSTSNRPARRSDKVAPQPEASRPARLQRPASSAALEFVAKAWRHCKPLAFTGGQEGPSGLTTPVEAMDRPGVAVIDPGLGVFSTSTADAAFAALFVEAVGRHRFWQRQASAPIVTDRT